MTQYETSSSQETIFTGGTEEVFLVQRVVPGPVVTYKLKEWDGPPLEGSFYEEDVQKVTILDDVLFHVEKIF